MPPRCVSARSRVAGLVLLAGGMGCRAHADPETDFALRRAALELAAGRPAAAAAVLRRAHPDAVGGRRGEDALLLLAESELLAGHPEAARPRFESLLAAGSEFVRAQAASHLLGLAAAAPDTAAGAATTWMRQAGGYSKQAMQAAGVGWLLAARLLYASGDAELAERTLARTPQGPARTLALLLRAEAALAGGAPNAAAEIFAQMLDERGGLFDGWAADWALLGRARALVLLGRNDQALVELDRVSAVPHLRDYAKFLAAQIQIGQSDLNGAAARLETLGLDSWDPRLAVEAALLRVQVALDAGRAVEAETLAVSLERRVPVMLRADAPPVLHPALRVDLDAWHASRTRATLAYLAARKVLRWEPRTMELAEAATVLQLAPAGAADSLAMQLVLFHPYQHDPEPSPGEAALGDAHQVMAAARSGEAGAVAEVQAARARFAERRALLDRAGAELDALLQALARLRARAAEMQGGLTGYRAALAAQERGWMAALESRLATLAAALRELERGCAGLGARYPADRSVRAHPEVDAARGTLSGAAPWIAAIESLQVDLARRTPQRVHDVLLGYEPARADSEIAALASRLAALENGAAELGRALAAADARERAELAAAEARLQEAEAATARARAVAASAWQRLWAENAAKFGGWERVALVASRDAAATGAFQAAVADPDSTQPDSLRLARLRHAARVLERFVALHPDAPRADEMWYRLGEVHLERAAVQYRVALARVLAAGGDAAQAGLPVEDYGDALAAFGALLERHPGSPRALDAHFQVGFLFSETGVPEVAAAHLETFLAAADSTDARRGRAALRLGEVRVGLGRRQEALAAYAIAARSGEPRVHDQGLFQFAWCAWELDRYDEARGALRTLLDGLAAAPPGTGTAGMGAEALELLALCFAADHQPNEAAAVLDTWGRPHYEFTLLRRAARLYENRAQFAEAIRTWELLLERHPLHPGAPGAAVELLRLVQAQEGQAAAQDLAARLAPRFAPRSEWARQAAAAADSAELAPAWQSRLVAEEQQAARSDSLSKALERPEAAAAQMAQLLRASAVYAHREARGDSASRRAQLELAIGRYQQALALFPGAEGEHTTYLYLGEALYETGRFAPAADAYAAACAHAAADSATRSSAARQELAALDAACARDVGLLDRYDARARTFLVQHPQDSKGLDALERVGEMAFGAGRWEQAESAYADFAATVPDPRRGAAALKAVGDTWWRREEYRRAAEQYDAALGRARSAHADSLARTLVVLVPGALYRAASADEEKGRKGDAAAGFESVASDHPGFEYADQALYRAARLRTTLGDTASAVADYQRITSKHPRSSLVPDALLETGALQAAQRQYADAARTYLTLAGSHAGHPQARASWLRAGELFERAGSPRQADSTYAQLQRVLGSAPADTGLAAQLWMRRAKLATSPEAAASHYEHALEHRAALSAADRAEAVFQLTDRRRPRYEGVALTQPLAESLPRKQAALEGLLAGYGDVIREGVEPWHAAACLRVGECLEHLGESLRTSQAPEGLGDADVAAYRQALQVQAQVFTDRAADAWSEGLRAAQVAELTGTWTEALEARLYPVLARLVPTQPTPLFVVTPP